MLSLQFTPLYTCPEVQRSSALPTGRVVKGSTTYLRAVANCRRVARDVSQSPWRTHPSIRVMQLPPRTSAAVLAGQLVTV
jgi:hypothetical protein